MSGSQGSFFNNSGIFGGFTPSPATRPLSPIRFNTQNTPVSPSARSRLFVPETPEQGGFSRSPTARSQNYLHSMSLASDLILQRNSTESVADTMVDLVDSIPDPVYERPIDWGVEGNAASKVRLHFNCTQT